MSLYRITWPLSDWKFEEAHLNVLADFCADQNPNFGKSRWLDYIDGRCGPNGGTIKTHAEALS